MKRIRFLLVAGLLAGIAGRTSVAEDASEPAVRRGVEFLKTQIPKMNSGEAALAAFTMSKAHVPVNDPGLVACIARFGVNFHGTTYTPETRGGAEIYEASMAIMAMANIDRFGYRPYIQAAGEYILSKQMPNGAWDYSNRTAGDVSITQYALLGLWEGENAGVLVPAKVWEGAAKWCLSMQSSQGSWNAQRDVTTSPETLTMTAAGVESLMLCQRQLARYRRGQEPINPLMTAIIIDGVAAELWAAELRPKVEPSTESLNKGVRAGIQWMSDHFQTTNSPIVGPSIFECLCGVERVIALAQGSQTIVPSNWPKRGLAYVLATQRASGAWDADRQKTVSNTCWAILFTVKAMADTVRREEIRRRLLSVHCLPRFGTDRDDLDIVQGELVVKPMGGAIEGMLDALEDPKGEKAEAALNGLIARYQAEGSMALRPHKERFRKLINDRDSGLRSVAAWALGRTGDLDVAPLLIKSLLDPEDAVANEATEGLQFLSRKLDGLGPEPNSTIEQRRAAALQWRQWFESVKPPDLDSPDELPIDNATPAAK